MKVLLTGHSGFLGSALTVGLKQEGYEILTFDGDITDINKLQDRCDVILHFAGKVTQTDTITQKQLIDTNIVGSYSVCEYARKNRSPIIFASSAALYAPLDRKICEEDQLQLTNLYAQTKYVSEQIFNKWSEETELSVINLRIFNPYGPKQSPEFLIPYLIERAVQNKNLELKRPFAERDFIHTKDITSLVLKILDSNEIAQNQRLTINVGTGELTQINKLAQTILMLTNSQSKITLSEESTHLNKVGADITKAKTIFNWSPNVSLMEGLSEIIHKDLN